MYCKLQGHHWCHKKPGNWSSIVVHCSSPHSVGTAVYISDLSNTYYRLHTVKTTAAECIYPATYFCLFFFGGGGRKKSYVEEKSGPNYFNIFLSDGSIDLYTDLLSNYQQKGRFQVQFQSFPTCEGVH